MSKERRAPRHSLLTIFITVFIDMLGVSIIIPVIPALFFEEQSGFFDPAFPQDSRSILYGFLIAAYPIMQFFGAPLLGALSDRYGRKPMLSLSLLGTLLGYLLFGLAINNELLWLLFASRMLPGFTGGNIAIILSSISDVSDQSSRAKNFGLVGTAFGIGFILGPTIGGILADGSVVSWFNPATPFWFTAILTTINIVLVQFRFRETLQEHNYGRTISVFTGFRNIAFSFQSPNLREILSVVLLLSLGFTFFTQFFSVLLIDRFDFTEKNIGLLYGWIGIWLALTQGVTVRILSRYFSSTAIVSVMPFFLAVSIGLILVPDQSWWFYVITPLIATSQGTTTPNLTAVLSSQASAEEQGKILGVNQSMSSVGQAIPPIVAGYLNTLNGNLPLLSATFFVFIAWLVYFFLFYPKYKQREQEAALQNQAQ